MIITEKEAQTKWCPHWRKGELVVDGSSNVGTPASAAATNTNAHCIASRCMAWRWSTVVKYSVPASMTSAVEKVENMGYCGLAGKAEA